MKCDKEIDGMKLEGNQTFMIGQQHNTLRFRSKYACALADFYQIWKFINKYSFIFCTALILVGIFEAILGNYFMKATTYIICMATVVVFVFIFMFQIVLPSGCRKFYFI